MGRVSQKKKRAKVKKLLEDPQPKHGQTTHKDLLDSALQFFQNGDEENARKIAKRVVKQCDDGSILTECGALLSEVGENKLALDTLRRSVTLCPDSGYEKFLTLGQLCSSAESLKFLDAGIELLRKEAPLERRRLSKAFCSKAELFMTDLCMEQNAQQNCQNAVENALDADRTNPEAHHVAASFLISSNKKEEAKNRLREGIKIWFEKHEIKDNNDDMMLPTPEIAPDDKLDVSVRMNALRLAFELEMWEDSIQIARQLSEEEVEDCEPRYFLALSLFKSLAGVTDEAELAETRADCYDAAIETKRLATDGVKKRNPMAKDVLGQITELLEDLGPVDLSAEEEEAGWETDEEMEES